MMWEGTAAPLCLRCFSNTKTAATCIREPAFLKALLHFSPRPFAESLLSPRFFAGVLRGCEEIDQGANCHPEAAGAPSERQRARCAQDAEGSPVAAPVAGAAHFEILRRPPRISLATLAQRCGSLLRNPQCLCVFFCHAATSCSMGTSFMFRRRARF